MKAGLEAFGTSVDKFFHQNEQDMPGLAVIIRNDSGVVFSKNYGVQDRETEEALREDAIYPVASQSKTFAAVAILKLSENGDINLNAELTDYLPNLAHPLMEGVTVRDALAHNTKFLGFDEEALEAGIQFDGLWPLKSDLTPEELKEKTVKDSFFRDDSCYSNAIYAQLGLIVEEVSGMPYNDFIEKEIINKHYLKDVYASYNRIPDSDTSRIATGYKDHPNELDVSVIEQNQDAGLGAPACGVFASSEGISDFYHKLFSGQILSQSYMDEIRFFDRVHTYHGLGISVPPSGEQTLGEFGDNLLHIEGHEIGNMLGHAGLQGGYASETRFNVETGLTMSVIITHGNDTEGLNDLNDRLNPKRVIQLAFQEILDHPEPQKLTSEINQMQSYDGPT